MQIKFDVAAKLGFQPLDDKHPFLADLILLSKRNQCSFNGLCAFVEHFVKLESRYYDECSERSRKKKGEESSL